MNNRRKFLQALAVAPVIGAGCAQTGSTRQASLGARPGSSRHPRKIIHLVADGMSAGTLSCANHFSENTRGRGLTFFEASKRDGAKLGFMDMRSQNSIVTDSSAASSVWGSGVRIPNGKVNQASDGRKLVTLYELLADAGWKRALVTTTEVTHATPAGFVACTASRENADEIAAQYLDRGVDIVLGGGRKFFNSSTRKDKRDLLRDYRSAGYAVLQKPSDLASAPSSGRILGVFSESHIPYVVDKKGGVTKVADTPGLAAMTRAALHALQRENRFILQVEGGRVDHACHAMDAAGAMHEMIDFDEAIDVCLEFQRQHPDTLLVITTDHGNGNPALNGMGSGYKDSPKLFRNIPQIKVSIGEIAKALKKADSPEQLSSTLKELTGYTASTRRMELLKPYLQEKGTPLYESYKSDIAGVSQVLANYTGMSFTSGSHTSDLVPVLAYGRGAEAFQGLIQGPDVFVHYLGFANIRFRNPQEALVASAATEQATENIAEYMIG